MGPVIRQPSTIPMDVSLSGPAPAQVNKATAPQVSEAPKELIKVRDEIGAKHAKLHSLTQRNNPPKAEINKLEKEIKQLEQKQRHLKNEPTREDLTDGIPKFSATRILSEMVTAGNIGRGVKAGFYESILSPTKGAGKMVSSEAIVHNAKVGLATEVAHTAFKIGDTFHRKEFGDNLLVTTRNIGNKEVLRNREDLTEYKKYDAILKAKINNEDYGKGKISFEETEKIDISANRDGVCLSTCMSIAKDVVKLTEKNDENLKDIVTPYSKGVPAQVAGIQILYGNMKVLVTGAPVIAFGKENADAFAQKAVIANLYGFEQDEKGTKDSFAIVGRYENKTDSAEHLENFHKLEPGTYQTSFTTGPGGHAILYIKESNTKGYFFDPNKGLIKCDENKPHANTYLKLLSQYPPPDLASRTDKQGKVVGEDNYLISISKYKDPASSD